MNNRKIYFTPILAIVLILIGNTVQAQSWQEKYYKKNPTSLASIKDSYGEPLNIIEQEGGIQKMIFGPKDKEMGYTYFLVKDENVIDKGMTESLEKKKVTPKYAGPTPGGFTARYYTNHPTSVEQLKAGWGEPVSVRTFDNGITKMVFGPKDKEMGYTYFLIKNGMAVDRNTTAADCGTFTP